MFFSTVLPERALAVRKRKPIKLPAEDDEEGEKRCVLTRRAADLETKRPRTEDVLVLPSSRLQAPLIKAAYRPGLGTPGKARCALQLQAHFFAPHRPLLQLKRDEVSLRRTVSAAVLVCMRWAMHWLKLGLTLAPIN